MNGVEESALLSGGSSPGGAETPKGDDSQVGTATFEQTGDPLLLIGRASGQRSQGDTAEALYRSPFQ